MSQEVNQDDIERPLFVKSTNFKHSTNLKYPNEPPTDRQIILLKKIGYRGLIPKSRGHADYEIRKIQNRLTEQEIKNCAYVPGEVLS